MSPEILGCYKSQKREKMDGGPTGREVQRTDWLVIRIDDAHIMVFPLDKNRLPLPLPKTVAQDEFLSQFLPAPLAFTERLAPAVPQLIRKLREKGDALEPAELPEPERTLFAVILVALAAAGETNVTAAALAAMAGLAGTAAHPLSGEAQKFAINAFGINLRKQKEYDTAAAYYQVAMELAPDDERILFNLARTLFEKGDLSTCHGMLEQALTLAPDFIEARKFLHYLKRRRQSDPDEIFPDMTTS